MTDAERDTDDQRLLDAIMNAPDPASLAVAMWTYYHDNAGSGADHRANRTSRELIYLHIGMLCGAIHKATAPPSLEQEMERLTIFQAAARKAGLL